MSIQKFPISSNENQTNYLNTQGDLESPQNIISHCQNSFQCNNYSEIKSMPSIEKMMTQKSIGGKDEESCLNQLQLITTNNNTLTNSNNSRLEDIDNNKICRICFDNEQKQNKLISPCNCNGSAKYIHEKCLNQWLESNQIWKTDQFPKCELCKFKYEAVFNFKKVIAKDKCLHVTKYVFIAGIILIALCAAVSVTVFTILNAILKFDEIAMAIVIEGLVIGSICLCAVLLIVYYCRIKNRIYNKELVNWRFLDYSETIRYADLEKTKKEIGRVIMNDEYPYIFFRNYEIVIS